MTTTACVTLYLRMLIDGEKVPLGQSMLPCARRNVLVRHVLVSTAGIMIERRPFASHLRWLRSVLEPLDRGNNGIDE